MAYSHTLLCVCRRVEKNNNMNLTLERTEEVQTGKAESTELRRQKLGRQNSKSGSRLNMQSCTNETQ